MRHKEGTLPNQRGRPRMRYSQPGDLSGAHVAFFGHYEFKENGSPFSGPDLKERTYGQLRASPGPFF